MENEDFAIQSPREISQRSQDVLTTTDERENDQEKILDFFQAVHKGFCKKVRYMLKNNQIDVNVKDGSDPCRRTALFIATENNDVPMARVLVGEGIRTHVDCENTNGRRPIWLAASHGYMEFAQLLLRSDCDVNQLDPKTGCSPLYQAVLSKNSDMVKLLVHNGSDVNLGRVGCGRELESPLMQAVQLGNKEVCEVLLSFMCDVHAQTEHGFTVLHYAVAYKRYEICKMLLRNNAQLHARSHHGVTPMTVAIEQQNATMCRSLIQAGYNMDKPYRWKETPLDQAIRLQSQDCAITIVHWGCRLKTPRGKPSYFCQALSEGFVRLSKLLLAINPEYAQEDWIRKQRWPLALYHRPKVLKWLLRISKRPPSLQTLVRGTIVQSLGRHPQVKIERLPLPVYLKDFLSLKDFIKDSMYARTPLGKEDCPFDCPSLCLRRSCPPVDMSSDESDIDM